MVNEYLLCEIMTRMVKSDASISDALDEMKNYGQIQLKQNENYEPYYSVDVSTILGLDIDASTLFTLAEKGWSISNDKKELVRFLN